MSENEVRFSCPACGKRLKTSVQEVGRRGTCSECGASFEVPASVTVSDAMKPPKQSIRTAPVQLITRNQLNPALSTSDRFVAVRPTVRNSVVVNTPKQITNSLGIGSVILGIVAFVICMVPIINVVSIPMSAMGVVLGLAGLFVALNRGGTGVGYAVAGSLISGIALAIPLMMYFAIGSALADAGQRLDEHLAQAQLEEQRQQIARDQAPGQKNNSDVANPPEAMFGEQPEVVTEEPEVQRKISDAKPPVIIVDKSGVHPAPREPRQITPEDRERFAARRLSLAKQFREQYRDDAAKKYLNEVIVTWPETKAAKEAAELLKELSKTK